jgi:hypothetical protein
VKAATFEGWAAEGEGETILPSSGGHRATPHQPEDVMFDPLMHHDLAILKMREMMDAADNERKIRDVQRAEPEERVVPVAPARRRLWFARLAHPRLRRI